jgi:hypothetical protein
VAVIVTVMYMTRAPPLLDTFQTGISGDYFTTGKNRELSVGGVEDVLTKETLIEPALA